MKNRVRKYLAETKDKRRAYDVAWLVAEGTRPLSNPRVEPTFTINRRDDR